MSVYNPIIPYCDRISHPLSTGTLIRVKGSPHPTSRCFAINLQCGPNVNPRDDIALHLSPVFSPPPRVVRNSLQMQRWGPEESYGGFPFIGGQTFEILILVDLDHFKIAINGSHFTEFRHRIEMCRVTYLAIDGEVSIASITYEGTTQSFIPPVMPSAPPAIGMPPYPTGAVPYPTVPGAYGVGPPPVYGPPQSAMGYPPQSSYAVPTYPPQQSYSTSYPNYPNPSYPNPSAGYPHSPNSSNKGILGGALGGTLGGLAAGAAATSIGSAILGNRLGGHPSGGHHKHSNPIPIAGLAAGAGAAALGAAVLTGHHPFKKAKKLFKHKGFKHKWHKPKFGKWKHKGWSSGSSSD